MSIREFQLIDRLIMIWMCVPLITRHPNAALFHIAFKMIAVIVYLFGGFLFSETFMGTYVTLIILISMDFWTVKNVTGRLMVGLRWWNFIDEEGNSHWIFENRHRKTTSDLTDRLSISDDTSNTADATLFWAAIILYPIVWFFLLLVAVFRLNVQYFVSFPLTLGPFWCLDP